MIAGEIFLGFKIAKINVPNDMGPAANNRIPAHHTIPPANVIAISLNTQ